MTMCAANVYKNVHSHEKKNQMIKNFGLWSKKKKFAMPTKKYSHVACVSSILSINMSAKLYVKAATAAAKT